MAKSYAQLTKEIEALKAHADNLRRKEAGDVIARIKEAIEHYELTPADLFGAKGRRGNAGRAPARKGTRSVGSVAPYSDGAGNTWGGRGPRPHWLRDALAAGKQLSDFQAKSKAASNGTRALRKTASKSKRRGAIKYRDDAGNAWTGVGRKPQWFVDALAAGKRPEDLAA